MIHLIYTSVASQEFDPGQLPELLSQSRQANAEAGLTGMLLYAEGTFFQVLEGPAEAVDAVFGRIQKDPRHGGTTLIIREPIRQRCFPDWSMGYSELSAADLATMEGVNDVFQDGSCLSGLGAGRARKVLAAFTAGRWRSRMGSPRLQVAAS